MASRDPLAHPEEAIRRLYAYVAYRIGPGPDAEDVVSETIERALRYRESYEPAKGSPNAWLFGIAKRCIFDAAHFRAAQSVPPEEELEGWSDDTTGRAEGRVDLQRALAGLDDDERELIALRYGADLTSKEIGRLLDIKPGTVDVAIHRTLARLRDLLEKREQRRPNGV